MCQNHSKEGKLFKCQEENCDKAYATQPQLNQHNKTVHIGFKCDQENCNYKATSLGHLQLHKKKHQTSIFSCLGRIKEGEFPKILEIEEFCPEIQGFFDGSFNWTEARKIFSELMGAVNFQGKAKIYFLMFGKKFKNKDPKNKQKVFLIFLSYIFYIGKGGKFRHLAHLLKNNIENNVSLTCTPVLVLEN